MLYCRTGRRKDRSDRMKRKCKQVLDDLKEKRNYWKMKQKALDRTLLRTGFGRGCRPLVRQENE